MNTWKPETHLAIAADSIESLRACDVYRLLDTAPTYSTMARMAIYLRERRDDLCDELQDCAVEIVDERRALGDRGNAWFEIEQPTALSLEKARIEHPGINFSVSDVSGVVTVYLHHEESGVKSQVSARREWMETAFPSLELGVGVLAAGAASSLSETLKHEMEQPTTA